MSKVLIRDRARAPTETSLHRVNSRHVVCRQELFRDVYPTHGQGWLSRRQVTISDRRALTSCEGKRNARPLGSSWSKISRTLRPRYRPLQLDLSE